MQQLYDISLDMQVSQYMLKVTFILYTKINFQCICQKEELNCLQLATNTVVFFTIFGCVHAWYYRPAMYGPTWQVVCLVTFDHTLHYVGVVCSCKCCIEITCHMCTNE